MTTKAVADIISQLLGGIFVGIESVNLRASVWEGLVSLTDLSLNKQNLNPYMGDFRIISSHIEQVWFIM